LNKILWESRSTPTLDGRPSSANFSYSCTKLKMNALEKDYWSYHVDVSAVSKLE
jgi:hypothetical protein